MKEKRREEKKGTEGEKEGRCRVEWSKIRRGEKGGMERKGRRNGRKRETKGWESGRKGRKGDGGNEQRRERQGAKVGEARREEGRHGGEAKVRHQRRITPGILN